MHSERAKVLHTLAGRPLLRHVLAAVEGLAPDRVHIVYGHGATAVREQFADVEARWVDQVEQLGTGHAVAQALPQIEDDARVLIVYGDVPLIRSATLAKLARVDSGVVLLTAVVPDPTGYGRILRDRQGNIAGVVEQRDASVEQLAIEEINTGVLAAPAGLLRRWVAELSNDNAQREYYLTDVIALAARDGAPVTGRRPAAVDEILGVNSRADLARLERAYQRRCAADLMADGLTLRDPDRFDLRGVLRAGRDCEIDVNVVIEGDVVLGDRVVIGPNNVIRHSRIGSDVRIQPNCVIEDAVIGDHATIGPFSRIRPGTDIAADAHIGNFVEIKNSTIGEATKVNHLSYVGDTTLGRGVNIGAGVITCNYDGARKHRTEIGDHVFVGSNSQLVAPVRIGKGATIGAGSTITADVPDDTLAVGRGRQRHIRGWRRPKKEP